MVEILLLIKMIKNVEILPDKLKIFFSNKEEIFLNIWLRDHAQDDNSWDKRSCLLYTSPSPRDED